MGQRLRAVEQHLGDDDVFMANYTDGLSDLPLPAYLEHFDRQDRTASFVCVRPNHSFHVVGLTDAGFVRSITNVSEAGLWINGGFFVFKRRVFDCLKQGEDLVQEPFRRLIEAQQLVGYRYHGFWACMDTFKDKQRFDDMEARGERPWEVWTRA